MLETYRRLWELLDAHERRRAILLFCLILVMGLAEAMGVASVLPFMAVLTNPDAVEASPILTRVRDGLGYSDSWAFLEALGGIMLAALLFSLAMKAVTNYANTRFVEMRNYGLSSRLLSGYLRMPYAWHLDRHSAQLGQAVLAEVGRVTTSMMMPALRLITQGVVIVFLVGLLIAVQPQAAIVAALVLGGLYGIIFFIVRRKLSQLGEIRLEMNRRRFKIANESTGGVKDLKVLGREGAAAGRFRAPALTMARAGAAMSLIGVMPRFLLEAVVFGGMLALALSLVAEGEGAVDEALPLLALYAFAGSRLFPALQQVYGGAAQMRSGRPVLDQLHADLEEAARLAEADADPAAPPIRLTRELRLEGARYAYPQAARPALDGADMVIPANATVGIVGGTGAGKTTAVDVMLGLLPLQEGTLSVDGVTIDEGNHRVWQRSIGYVPQSIFLVDDTVSANIAFGERPDAVDAERVERAARMAELHRFVTEELPSGYDTWVGERGVRLSGGQRQRIGIARALYRDPDVLILDEATSALDNLTERAVMEAVANLGGRKTVVMIAHRLSTVRECDVIFLMERGRVSAQGTYDELVEGNALFREMARGVS